MSVNFIINQIKEKWNNLTRGVSVKVLEEFTEQR